MSSRKEKGVRSKQKYVRGYSNIEGKANSLRTRARLSKRRTNVDKSWQIVCFSLRFPQGNDLETDNRDCECRIRDLSGNGRLLVVRMP